MKRVYAIYIFLLSAACLSARTVEDVRYVFTEASELNIIGKIHENTPNPYHRVDTLNYKGFTASENIQVRCSAGLAVVFRTNSSTISVLTDYGYVNHGVNTMGLALRGYDLYIKKDGEWLYAESGCNSNDKLEQNCVIIRDMDHSMKECMLYLPIYSEIRSCKIGVEEGSVIEPIESPFRHRVGIFGSSFTQGISISRSGMSYPMQFMRNTGIQILNLGCSGNCKMQPYFADVLCDADVDALIFDAFSNPSAAIIEERLFPFIERIQETHPDIPLIFQQTIYRDSRNFNLASEENEAAKQATAERLMREACRKYDNVYFVQTNATDKYHNTSVDATHPDNYGYTLWAESIEKHVMRILKKHGIR